MRTVGKLYKPHPLVTDVYQPDPDAARISRELRLSPYTRIGALAGLGRHAGRRQILVLPIPQTMSVAVRRIPRMRHLSLWPSVLPRRLEENLPAVLVVVMLLILGVLLTRMPRSAQPSGQTALPQLVLPAAAYTGAEVVSTRSASAAASSAGGATHTAAAASSNASSSPVNNRTASNSSSPAASTSSTNSSGDTPTSSNSGSPTGSVPSTTTPLVILTVPGLTIPQLVSAPPLTLSL